MISPEITMFYKNQNDSIEAANFFMGGQDNGFRLNAKKVKQPSGIVGSKHNIDLDPNRDAEIIFTFLKYADMIYEPPTHP